MCVIPPTFRIYVLDLTVISRYCNVGVSQLPSFEPLQPLAVRAVQLFNLDLNAGFEERTRKKEKGKERKKVYHHQKRLSTAAPAQQDAWQDGGLCPPTTGTG